LTGLAPFASIEYNMRISNGCQRGGHEHTTLTPQAHQLLVPFVIFAVIAFVSERSHVLASVISVMPFNITFGLWFVYTSNGGDAVGSADFSRMVTLGPHSRDAVRRSLLVRVSPELVAGSGTGRGLGRVAGGDGALQRHGMVATDSTLKLSPRGC